MANRVSGARLLASLSIVSPSLLWAQGASTPSQRPAAPAAAPTASAAAARAITPSDISNWKSIRGATLSLDGAWFAYTLAPNEGDAEVVIRNTAAAGKEYRFPVGEAPAAGGGPFGGGGGAQLSPDGKWAAFLVYPKAAEQKRMRTARRPIQAKATVVNLATGEKREFDKIRRITFGGESPKWIALQGYGPDAPAGAPPGAPAGGAARVDGTDLLLHELGTETIFNVGNVADFAFDDKARWIAYTIDARDQLGNGVQLRELATGVVKSIDAGKSLFRRLAWSDTVAAFAFLRGTVDSAGTDTTWAASAVSRVGTPLQKMVTVGLGNAAGLPNGMEVSPERTPRWMESMDGVMIGLRVATVPVPRSEQLEDDDRPTLMLWHGKDSRLQSMQQVQENADKSFSFLATYWPATGKVVQLTDDELRTGTIGGKDTWMLAYDNRAYERRTNLDGIQRRDAYLVDPRTGARTLVKKELRSFAQLSTTGKSLLFWDDGNYHVYDVATKVTTNITKGAPVSFIDTEDDHNVDRPATPTYGWSRDGNTVLLSDNWDIWKVATAGNSWTNLTVDGRTKQIRYRRPMVTDPRAPGYDLTKPLYITAMQEWTKKEAFLVLDPKKAGAVVQGGWRDSRITPMKARDADVWVSSIQTFARFPDYWRVSWSPTSAGDSIRLTDANPNMNGVAWSPGARLVNYVSDKGDTLQGALYLPAGYKEGEKYPTVVFIYEKLSDGLHQFSPPTFTSSYTPGLHTSRGYAVFQPDIVYKINDPGMSAVWSVVPAVKAAIKTGIVDSANVGLHGHSWGGYQTAFLVGQTNIFKSAVAGAPLTDMISMYSSVYWNTGSANQPIFQSSQGRFKGNFIENREAYERNSPNRYADKIKTPLIILHDDKDGAVDFNQGITFYNTLRQMDKDVILLEYIGENHGLAQLKNRKDYVLRLQDYWDSYLKGEKAPEWLEKGIPRLKMEQHLREMKKKLDPPKKIAM